MQKQVLAIHDLSCVGRCSLTVALPVLSAAGLHVSVLPTALLSTHTGEFTGYTNLDLTQEMAKIYAHFQTLPLRFDGLYSGFLGSWEQLALVEDVFAHYRRADTLLLVDPVMADHGKLYATYTETLARDMGRLCRQADVIVPNLTEAAILLEASYREQPSFPQVEAMLRALHKRYGCRQAVITGILRDGLLGAAAYDAQRDCVFFHGQPPMDHVFYGTGDVLASALLAGLMRGRSLSQATTLAVDFTYQSMLHTLDNGLPLRYGVAFEQALPMLVRSLESNAC
ncbi:MAG TPA: pyridoxamine kinase [Candidatus Egerieenecus merdigallinarum]|nr:pyridoxamine kinase [Candidatus Egerieenecus merdigallinarum]